MHEAAARGGDNSPLALAQSQLIALTRLQRRVSEVGAGGLASMCGEVTAMVAATQAVAQPGTALDVQAQKLAQVSLQQASVAARESVASFARDYYENRIFDRYLKFASVEDEEEYRRREEERKQAIDKALAEHTPRGDLRANQFAIDQLKDAGVHGAARSPEYKARLEQLQRTNRDLTNAVNESRDKSAAKTAADALDPNAEDPPAGISPDVIAQLRCAKVSAASNSAETCGAAPPPSGAGSTRTR